jgi:hypothetical protein
MRRNIVGFHINVYNMPYIETYEQAKEVFNSKTLVRGEQKSIRRLGGRYEKEKWIRQEMQDGIEYYVAGYYNTDLVRFYPTHKEITLGSYPSLSTQYFVERIGRVGLYPFEHKRYVPAPFTRSPMVKNHHIECFINQLGDKFYMNAHDWYKLDYSGKPLDEGQYEKPIKYKFDASHMRGLRTPYKSLLKYIDTLIKLGNAGVEYDTKLSEQIPDSYESILEFMKHESNMYASYYYLVRQTQHRVYHREGNKYHVTIGMVKRYLDKMIKLENPQVLVEVQPTDKPIV